MNFRDSLFDLICYLLSSVTGSNSIDVSPSDKLSGRDGFLVICEVHGDCIWRLKGEEGFSKFLWNSRFMLSFFISILVI